LLAFLGKTYCPILSQKAEGMGNSPPRQLINQEESASELPQIPNDEAGLTLSTFKKYISRSFGDISV
jgi:hypothetical protein